MGRSECSFPQGCADGMKSFCSPQSVRGWEGCFSWPYSAGACWFPWGNFSAQGRFIWLPYCAGCRRMRRRAFRSSFFCLYVGAMCIPALLIILLVAGGKSILALSEGSLRRMPAVKLCYAALFIVFAVFSLYMLI